MAVAKEQIRQIISENNINSVADIYTLLKDSFKDILQELMEAELDATLGYEKNHKGDLQTDNKRNGHSTKNLKSQYGEFQIDVPRDRNGEFEPKLIPKYQRDISGIEAFCRVDAPLAVVRPSQNPDLRLSRIRLFAKRIVHIYQLYTLTYIRGLTNG